MSWDHRGLPPRHAGVTVWRFELVPADAPVVSFSPPSGSTSEKLRQRLKWPVADQILIRNDSVSFPPGGCAFLHTHQGPGIRCLIEGGIRIDTLGHSTSYGPGGAWFESGSDPVFAQAAEDRRTRFIRVMVLPARLKGQSSIAYVNAEDREKPKSQSYKGYVDQPMGLKARDHVSGGMRQCAVPFRCAMSTPTTSRISAYNDKETFMITSMPFSRAAMIACLAMSAAATPATAQDKQDKYPETFDPCHHSLRGGQRV